MERSLDAATRIRAPLERAREVLSDDPGTVLAGRCTAEDRRQRRFRTMLTVGVGSGASLQQEIAIDALPVRHGDAGFALPIRWQATGHGRFLPSFDGELVLSGDSLHTELALRGAYIVPLGPVGAFGDGLAGRRLVRRSLEAYLDELARRLDAEADRRVDAIGWHPAPYPITLHESTAHSEQFIG
jgi:hypothetical protein